MKKTCSKKKKFFDKEIDDDWFFDIGYHFAFSIIIFTIVFIFSTSAPLVPIFGFMFFSLKYIIDKYNFMYVYPTEFESKGTLTGNVSTFTTVALFLFQIMMFSLFTTIFGNEFTIASIILVMGEALSLIIFKVLNVVNLKSYFNDEFDEDDDEEYYNDATDRSKRLMEAKDFKSEIHLSSEHIIALKESFQHPYETFHRVEKAKSMLNSLERKDVT